MKTYRTNLVIACWSGIRRVMHPKYIKDRTFYVKKQLEYLTKYSHNLDQITLVISQGFPSEASKRFEDYVKSLDTQINGIPLKVIFKENLGMSYGAFNFAYKNDPTFDFYYFLEDDYLFVKDNWDKDFEDQIVQDPKAGYVCMHVGDGGGVYSLHAAIPMGILRKEAIEEIVLKYGEIPFAKSAKDYTANEAGQVAFGNSFVDSSFQLKELKGFTPVSSFPTGIVELNEEKKYICVPIQVVER